ncbi:conjugal transfer protein TraB [Paraburkholderia sp. SIMBA_030]|uniref:conjugal transfer protein TraB n=1 Tax=Paraburkholderia sp. SIMBA_030 TaxID=3085773 RepID=UPI00397A0F2E
MMRKTRFLSLPRAVHTRSARASHLQNSLFAACMGIAVAVLAWYPGNDAITLLALPAAWSRLRGRTAAFVLWVTYYLAGARDIPIVCERFFTGYHELARPMALVFGLAFWLLQAIGLAMPWAVLKPGSAASGSSHLWRAMLATLIATLPPVGIIGWLSPLHVASTLYAGWRLAGIGLGMAALCAAATRPCWPRTWLAWAALAGLSGWAHWQEPPRSPPAGWLAVDTALGRFDQSSYPSLYERTTQLQAIARHAFASGATVAILPEEIAGLWRPAMTLWWRADIERMRAAGQTLIIGTDLVTSTVPLRYTDSVVVAGSGHGRFDSRQPVPVALWRPGAQTSATRGSVYQPDLMIGGQRVTLSLCYEDLLWWPHWRMLLKRPDVVVSMSNGWFDADLALARIQQQSIESMARMAGVPLLRATNR